MKHIGSQGYVPICPICGNLTRKQSTAIALSCDFRPREGALAVPAISVDKSGMPLNEEASDGARATRQSNRILEALPVATRSALLSQIEYVDLPPGRVLYQPRQAPQHVHFLTSGLVSVATQLATGVEIDVGLIGCEGIIEAMHLIGATEVTTKAVVQVQATALRAPFSAVQREFHAVDPLRQLILQQIREQSLTATQLVACNAVHGVEARLARWLLMTADRLRTAKLQVTQQFLAEMIGARRPTVTVAAGKLQQVSAIRTSRAVVEILDRPRLESITCECYAAIKRLNSWLDPSEDSILVSDGSH